MTSAAFAQPVYVDLKTGFDTDAVLETGGAGLSDVLGATGERIDAGTLPAGYADGTAYTTADGRASFRFANLRQASLDAAKLNGQTIAVPNGKYQSVDFALVSAPGGYGNPFTTVKFRYLDGSSTDPRFGPLPGWFASPQGFDHTYYSYVDGSGVTPIVEFSTDWGDNEANYLLESAGNGNAGGVRFVDGNGYALYYIALPTDLPNATLGIRVGNNFVVSLASSYYDPIADPREGYTEVANSMKIYDGFEHRALGNLKLYEFDLKDILADQTGQLYILFTDATPSNGWGPYIQNISVYTGTNRVFAETLQPLVATNQAKVYAQFLTDGGTAEAPYLFDNSGSGPSNRKHRFADGSGSITYRFDLPDEVTDAKLTVDMANNFVVSVSGASGVNRYAQISPGAANEKNFLIDDGGSVLGGNYRFADGTAYMIYQFQLPADVTTAIAQISVGNQFVIEAASGTNGDFVLERDYVAETGDEITSNANLDVYNVDLAPYLQNNPGKIVRIRLSDGVPSNGWGPYLTGIAIVDRIDTGASTFQKVLDSQEMFGQDIHNEINKAYYTIDLSSVLKTGNPKKEVSVKFTDASTSDGWGPGIFWMAVYSGTLDIQSDGLIFDGLKALNGDPEGFGVNLFHRRYALDPSKTLKEIVLPAQPNDDTDVAYLMGATLTTATVANVALTAQRVTGGSIRLAWPSAATGYTLQGASTVPGAWTDVSAAPTVEGADNVVTLPATDAARFFRLKQ